MSKTDSQPTSSVIAPNTTLTLTFKWTEVKPVYDHAVSKLSSQVKLKGFREGKVPAALAKDAIGEDKIVEATLQKIVPPAYSQWLEAEKKTPLTHPEVEPVKVKVGEDWEVKVAFAEAPQITLGKYETLVKTGRAEADKDIAEQEKAPAKDKKDTKDQKTTPTPPAKPLTDEDKKELRLRKIFSHLVEGIKPAIPELLIREETRKELDQLLRSLEQLKIDPADYLKRRQISFEQLSGELASTAIARLQLEFIILAISDAKKFTATHEEIHQQIDKITNLEVRKQYEQDHHYHHYVGSMLTRQKTIDYLLSL